MGRIKESRHCAVRGSISPPQTGTRCHHGPGESHRCRDLPVPYSIGAVSRCPPPSPVSVAWLSATACASLNQYLTTRWKVWNRGEPPLRLINSPCWSYSVHPSSSLRYPHYHRPCPLPGSTARPSPSASPHRTSSSATRQPWHRPLGSSGPG